ncbi:E3 ubiquitin-protein ligase TRIM31-like [Mercenaria mercenaria]|uniref:E3 ubiquitin-protein ligase TRIM31-like n=1 Tax=Mercenaria mercenaria TaxID=6596 RepID=UPI00234E62AE|nr:E3 ubiquitin-protein ligase TRIM31-like [Mercenaria mercenaria]
MAALHPVLNGETLDYLLKCPICYDILKDPRAFVPCQHMFCLECILKYVENVLNSPGNDITCPSCRTSLNTKKKFFTENKERKQWVSCFPKHPIVSEMMSKFKTEDDFCKLHENKLNEHVCVNHAEVICSDCLRENHKQCTNIQSIKEYEPIYSNQNEHDIKTLKEESNMQLNRVQTFISSKTDELSKLEMCKIKLNSAIDHVKKNISDAEAKQNEISHMFSVDLNNLQDEVKESKDIYAQMKCNIDISRTKRNLQQSFEDTFSAIDSTNIMQPVSELQSDLATISDKTVSKRNPECKDIIQQRTNERQEKQELSNLTKNSRQNTTRLEDKQTELIKLSDRNRVYQKRGSVNSSRDNTNSSEIPINLDSRISIAERNLQRANKIQEKQEVIKRPSPRSSRENTTRLEDKLSNRNRAYDKQGYINSSKDGTNCSEIPTRLDRRISIAERIQQRKNEVQKEQDAFAIPNKRGHYTSRYENQPALINQFSDINRNYH